MTGRQQKRDFASRPGNPESWIRTPDRSADRSSGDEVTARLTSTPHPRCAAGSKSWPSAAAPLSPTCCELCLPASSPARAERLHERARVRRPHASRLHLERIEHWIRFGRDVAEQILDRRRRILSSAPNSVFAYVRWAAQWCRASTFCAPSLLVKPTPPFPSFRPGGEILLRLSGWPKVERVLHAIDAIDVAGVDPVEARPDHWRHVHNRLAAGEEPRQYLRERHSAWLKRTTDRTVTRFGYVVTTYFTTLAVGAFGFPSPDAEADLERQRRRPIGLYAVGPAGVPHVTELVAIWQPEPVASLLADRGYLPKGTPLLKPVLALPGQTVCRTDRTITVTAWRWAKRSTGMARPDVAWLPLLPRHPGWRSLPDELAVRGLARRVVSRLASRTLDRRPGRTSLDR